jgi:hypothetical protein
MRAGDPITSLAMSVTRAIDRDLPDIEFERRDGSKSRRRPHEGEIDVHLFPQTWGSTALGFGGIGGASMTTGDVVVVMQGAAAAVYFAGRHAYTVKRFNEEFFNDMKTQTMAPVGRHTVYEQ